MFRRVKLFIEAIKTARAIKAGANRDAEVTALMQKAGFGVKAFSVPLSEEAQDILLELDFEKLSPDDFKLTAEHIALIRRMRLTWNFVEAGGPQCEPVQSFAGGTAVDLVRGELGDISDMEVAKFMILLPAALNTFVSKAKFPPGNYTLKNMDAELLAYSNGEARELGVQFEISPDLEVEVTQDDITLAHGAIWEWQSDLDMCSAFEAGDIAGPTVDPKRPYGDMGCYELDVHRLLEWPAEKQNENGYIELTTEQEETAKQLHYRQLGVMQAFLENGEIEPDV